MPNIVFILTDDQRHDALGRANPLVNTPTMDALARRGVRFANAFVVTSICSPSRACCLTGRYGSANGVPGFGTGLKRSEATFARLLKRAGYRTGYVGKWHLPWPSSPRGAGFDFVVYFKANGPHYDRKVVDGGRMRVAEGFIEDYLAARSVAFIEEAVKDGRPFLLHHATQVPHMDHQFRWVPREGFLALYDEARMPLPASWNDDLAGKPPYLETSRFRTQAIRYGYRDPSAIRRHFRRYFAEVSQLDSSLGRIVECLDRLGIRDETWLILMGDNGWFMGEHGLTSKVLAYEESIRVPLIVSGPGLDGRVCDELALNADIAPTILELAGVAAPTNAHGWSLLPLIRGRKTTWRKSFLYEAIEPELGSCPILAVRDKRSKYIQTLDPQERSRVVFEELYDLATDPAEMRNLAGEKAHEAAVARLREELERLRESLAP